MAAYMPDLVESVVDLAKTSEPFVADWTFYIASEVVDNSQPMGDS